PGPEAGPDAPARLAVGLGDAVAVGGEAQRQRRHAERVTPAVVGAGEVLELLGAKAELLPVAVEAGPGQVEGEGVVAGGDRRVDGEHGVRGHELARPGERASLL